MTDTPSTMQAFRVLAWEHPAQLVETDVPTAGPGQVVVKVAGTGLCHSDFQIQTLSESVGESMGWQVPFTLGHEVGGHVAQVGTGVTRVAVGDPVALVSTTFCGDCFYCLRGQENNCVNTSGGRGFGKDGGLAEYVLVDNERAIIPLGDLDPATVGPLTDAGATAYHAVKRVLPRLGAGSTAVVIGAGGLGAFAIQFLRVLSGATVIAVDPNQARLDIALELGAHHAVVGVDDNTIDTLRQFGDGLGAAAVLDFAGFASTVTAGVAAVRPAGAYGLVGAGRGDLPGPLAASLPRDGEVFTFAGPTIADALDVIALAEAGLIRNEVDVYPFAEVEKAYEALRAGTLRGRAVIDFTGKAGAA